MARRAIRSDEAVALAAALAAHAGLVALLVWHPPGPADVPPPERMTVTLSEDVGLTSTSPQPSAQAAPDEAPQRGEPPAEMASAEPAPPQPQPEPPRPEVRKPEPVRKVEPPRPQVLPPRPVPKAAPPPRPVPAPRVQPSPLPRPAPAKTVSKAAPAAPPRPAVAAPARAATPPRAPAGGSRIGTDFLSGVRGAQASGPARTPPAATIGPAVRSALSGAISRQLKPKWVAPQGADAEKLVTILTWSLNRDGSLAGSPRVVRQDGITDANRAQAGRHAEQAIRAVQLAAPFDLPEEYYDAWKRVAEFRFDRKLSQ
ncbi:MAG: hypothetical protein KGL44_06320 [Sphingomonadales bacterium]|nr:hypothetical protein [Sphingomonadales bacterium]